LKRDQCPWLKAIRKIETLNVHGGGAEVEVLTKQK
jgi:hypothetical protein